MGDTVAYLTHQLVLRGVYNLTKAEGDMIKMRKIEFQVSIWCMVGQANDNTRIIASGR